MSFLRLNGWAIPAAINTGETGPVEHGDREPAFSGAARNAVRARKESMGFQVKPVSEMVAMAIRGAVLGLGNHWPFDSDIYTSGGLYALGTPVSTIRSALAADGYPVTNEAKFAGGGSCAVEKGITNDFTQNVRTGTETSSDTTGFTAIEAATILTDTAKYWQGTRSLRVITTAVDDGVKTNAQAVTASTKYYASFYVRGGDGSAAFAATLKDAVNVTQGTPVAFTPEANTWQRVVCSHTMGAGSPTAELSLEQTDGSGVTVYFDGFQLEAGDHETSWVDGTRAASSMSYSPALFGESVGDITIACWVRMRAANPSANCYLFRAFADSSDTTKNGIYAYRQSGNNDILFVVRDSAGSGWAVTYSTSPWTDDDWHHIACTYRRNKESGEENQTLYWDGVRVGGRDNTVHPDFSAIASGSAAGMHVGESTSGVLPANAMFDDLLVLPYAAPAAQVAGWYNLGRAIAALPKVSVDGDVWPGDYLTMLGSLRRGPYVSFVDGTARRKGGRQIPFDLAEV